MSNFKREVRYTVIKHSQLTDAQIGFLKNCIHGEGIPTVEAVVVESDWPEYEPVWKMIDDRVTAAPVEGGKAEYDAMAKAMTKDKTVTMSRDLAERLARNLASGIEAYSAQEEICKILAAPIVEADGVGEAISPVVERQPDAIIEGVVTSVGITHAIYASTVSLKHGEQVKLYASPPAPVSAAIDPCEWSDGQILDFLGVALRNVDLCGEVKLSEIRQGFEYVRQNARLDKAKELNI